MSDWITIVPMSGTNNETVIASFARNTGEARRVTVTCRTPLGGESTIVFTQDGQILIFTPSYKITTSASTSFDLSVEANFSYTVESDAEWVTLNRYSGSSGVTHFTVSIEENDEEQARYCNLTISNKSFRITQLYYTYSIPFTYNPSVNQYVNTDTGNTWGAEIIEIKKANGIGEVIFASAPTVIPLNAFSYYGFTGYQDLYSVTIPEGIERIHSDAFLKNINLTNVILPESLTYIGPSAFAGTGIEEIDIPDNVYHINGSFGGTINMVGCPNLKRVHIGSGVEKCADSFEFCTALPVIDGIRYADTCACIAVDKTRTHYTIKEGTKYIGNGSSTKLSGYAEGSTFEDCTNLTSVSLPSSLIEIGSWVFYGCEGLTAVTIPNGVKYIGSHSFYGCIGLTAITIPNSVMEIDAYCFAGRYYGIPINYLGTIAEWNAIDKSENWGEGVSVVHCTDGDITVN